MLSETDNRVLAYLSHRRAGLQSIGIACFREAGKARNAGTYPAAAHLKRMEERGLVRKVGSLYERADAGETPSLFQ